MKNKRKMKIIRKWARINEKRFILIEGIAEQREKYRRIAQRRHQSFTYMSYMEWKGMSKQAKNFHRADGLGWNRQSGFYKSYERWHEENIWWMLKQRQKWRREKMERLKRAHYLIFKKKDKRFLYRRRIMMRTDNAAQKWIKQRDRL